MSDESRADEQQGLTEKSSEELVSIIKDLRSENAKRRTDNKTLLSQVEQLQSSVDEVKQKEKLAEGKKDEVISDLQTKLNEINSKNKEFEEQVKKWNDYESHRRDLIKQKIGEDNWVESFGKLELTDLETIAAKLSKDGKLLEVDSGKGKNPPPNQELERLTKRMEELKGNSSTQALAERLSIQNRIDELKKKRG